MNSRLRDRILIVATALLFFSGIAALVFRRAQGPGPRLEDVHALARVHQFARAQALLQRYLQAHPHDPRAHLLMAQLATEPTNVHTQLALDHLRVLLPDSPKQAAVVEFLKGKAHYQEGRYDLTETCWNEALRLDPIVPEAGWALVDLLDKEGRTEEAHSLGMRLHELEPDPRDKARILLEMTRLDIEVAGALLQIELFEPFVKKHPENLPLMLTLGLALVRYDRYEEGLARLHDAVARNPESPDAWDAWLTGLSLTAEVERMADEFARMPKSLTCDPRLAKHEGMIAQNLRDAPRSVSAYRRAFAFEPFNQGVIYRYRIVLRQAGELAEFERMDKIYQSFKDAFLQLRGSFFESLDRNEDPQLLQKDFKQTRGAYLELVAIKTLGVKPHPELYRRMADLREKTGRVDEARAWHRLVLGDSPGDPGSVAALERLK